MKSFAELAFTPAVRELQKQHGSRAAYARMQRAHGDGRELGTREATHLAQADSFFMATVNEAGWPYVQHRGGPRGFLRVVSPTRLAFADFGGNRQFVSVGNVSRDHRTSLIVMDYRHRKRLKLMGRLRFEDAMKADAALLSAVDLRDYEARVERIGIVDLETFDWNCPQHITPRFTLEEVEEAARPLRERIRELEAQIRQQR